MARTHDEIETKYDVAADFELPPVGSSWPVSAMWSTSSSVAATT